MLLVNRQWVNDQYASSEATNIAPSNQGASATIIDPGTGVTGSVIVIDRIFAGYDNNGLPAAPGIMIQQGSGAKQYLNPTSGVGYNEINVPPFSTGSGNVVVSMPGLGKSFIAVQYHIR